MGEWTDDVMSFMDSIDPLADPAGMALNDAEALAQFRAWRPDAMWCADTGVLITSTGLDNFNESRGDRLLYRLLMEFNEGRRLWALEQAAGARADGDAAREKAARAYAKHAAKCNTAGALGQFAKLFKARCEVPASALNARADVIGTPSGVVDMDTGAPCPEGSGARDWLVTKRTAADVAGPLWDFDPDPRWAEFIDEIMCGDAERAAYLQRALGYSCLGGNPEEAMFVAYGATTRNGKGTLLNTVAAALGDYAAAAPPGFLLASRDTGGTDDVLASMAGKRLVTISEPAEGRRLDESKVKSLTGNDPVTTSRKYGRTFTYTPEFTMWLSCNRLPTVADTSVFTSGRIRVVPFERHFAPEEQDHGLKARFMSRRGLATVLAWLLEGFAEYRERGLDEPADVRAATGAYANVGGSSVRRFLDARCKLALGARCENNALKDAYAAFCASVGEDPMGAQKMRRELESAGVSKKRSHGRDFWCGVALLPEWGMHQDAPGGAGKSAPGGREGRKIMLV